uniref:Protein OPG079 n=1 Tax=Rousettus bat poxvirus TaxID=3141933 RepID=A0AAU7E1F6_9POXV
MKRAAPGCRNVKKVPTSARPAPAAGRESARHTCESIVSHCRALSKSSRKLLESVTLSPSPYSGCAGIHLTLVDALASKLVSPLIAMEGEAKIFKNKQKTADAYGKSGYEMYFLRVRPHSASPLLYQLLEAIYTSIREGSNVPPNMHIPSLDAMEERTFKEGNIYINRIVGAVVEFTNEDAPSRIVPIVRELEALATREAQAAKLVVAPVIVYRNATEIKVTFALKRLTLPSVVRTVVVDTEGEEVTLVMNESADDDEKLGGLGLVDLEEDEDSLHQESLFNV